VPSGHLAFIGSGYDIKTEVRTILSESEKAVYPDNKPLFICSISLSVTLLKVHNQENTHHSEMPAIINILVGISIGALIVYGCGKLKDPALIYQFLEPVFRYIEKNILTSHKANK